MNKILRTAIMVLIAVILLLVPASGISSNVAASSPTYVFLPTAVNSTAYNWIYGYTDARKVDGYSLALNIASPGNPSSVDCSDFTSTSYAHYISPYTHRASFPPDNATITRVWMFVYLYAKVGVTFDLEFDTYNSTGWSTIQAISPTYNGAGTWAAYHCNITADYTWNGSVLTNHTLVHIALAIFDTGVGPIYVDYVGLEYLWYPAPSAPSGPGPSYPTPWHFGASWLVSVLIVCLGGVGLLGMIACPAAMIKAHKENEDKLHAFSSFVIIESLFIVMFYAALAMTIGG